MTDPLDSRPPYGAAVGVAAAVLLGYLLTLAPTVTFWDAGEFIAAARTLGIPHPPGTPLFVLVTHVWGTIFPVGEWAFRTNFLSALFSAAAAGLFFLVAHESVRQIVDGAAGRALAIGGAAAAALIGAFTFTNWQNSNETEVYSIATFTIGAMAWLCHRWRAHRATEQAPRYLLLIVYLAGLSIGNHLLALLAGPAVVVFLAATLRSAPAAEPERRRKEWAQVAVVAGLWALLVGTGLGNTMLVIAGGICFVAAAIFAATRGAAAFTGLALLIAFVGCTPYLFLYLRSAQNPILNEAAPSTVDALLAVIRRAQYPVRTPFDDPTVPHGPENPGRSVSLILYQLANYVQYFVWQWAKATGVGIQVLMTLVFFGLGVRGSMAQRRVDRPAWYLILVLFLVTGLGLVAYMNFKPGFSLFYEQYPDPGDHEVRERDYFFVVSFITWGIWAGMGLASLARGVALRARGAAFAVLALALLPVALNWTAASRRHGPAARLAADFAYDLLNSVPPYGVLFTYGDNDTFPLWWAQEVEGIRRDVTVVCLALANTDWYARQLRDHPVRPLDRAALPEVWQDAPATPPEWPLHTMSDTALMAAMYGHYVREPQQIRIGPLVRTLQPGALLYPSEIVTLSILRQNIGRRPIVWAITAGTDYAGLRDYVLQQGIGFRLLTAPPDTTAPAIAPGRLGGVPLDIPTTERLLWDTYRYAGLLAEGDEELESTAASIATSLAIPHTQLAYAYELRGNADAMLKNLERAANLSPNPSLRAAIEDLRLRGLQERDTLAE